MICLFVNSVVDVLYTFTYSLLLFADFDFWVGWLWYGLLVCLGLVYSLFVIGVLLLLVVLGCYGCLLFGFRWAVC